MRETNKYFKAKSLFDQSSQSETNVGSSAFVVVLRDGQEITICDPLGLVATKGKPRNASRMKSEFEDLLSQKYENCQQLGHYRTGCPLLV